MGQPILTEEFLSRYFFLEESRGQIFWNERRKEDGHSSHAVKMFNSNHAFDVAGSVDKKYGFIRIGLLGANYKAHDVAWVLSHGEIPDGMRVVHISDDYTDNRPSNLKLVSKKKDCFSQIKVTKKTLASDAGGDKLALLIERLDKLSEKVDLVLKCLDKLTMPGGDNMKQSQRVKLLLSEFPGGSASRHELRDKWVAAGLRASSLPKAIMTAIDEGLVSALPDGTLTVI